MTTAKINQKEYLKRYLSNEKDSKKKKKKKDKHATGKSNIKIIDTDHFGGEMLPQNEDESDLFAIGDEAPQIVGIIDDRPPELKAKEDFNSSRWKKLSDDGSNSLTNTIPSKSGQVSLKLGEDKGSYKDKRGREGRNRTDSDESPPRRGKYQSHPKDKELKSRRDTDECPPRRGKHQQQDYDSDKIPRKKRTNSDESPPRGFKSQSHPKDKQGRTRRDSDESPPRKGKHSLRGFDADRSPRRNRMDSDESPPRRSKSQSQSKDKREKSRRDSDESPPRKGRQPQQDYDSDKISRRNRADSDESPPRRSKSQSHPNDKRDKSKHDSDESSTRKGKQSRGYDSDQSPPRKNHRKARSDSDESPPRRNKHKSGKGSISNSHRRSKERDCSSKKVHSDSDASPPRRKVDKNDRDRIKIKQEKDASPVRYRDSEVATRRIKQEPVDSDESPPRKSTSSYKRKSRSRSRDRADAGRSGTSRMATTLEGKRAGLQDARDLREENERFRERENELFDNMSAEVSGRFAKTKVREKSGKRRDVEEELRKEFEKRKRDEKKKEVYTRWGKGVKQVEDYNTQLKEAEHEMSKPLARYANDEDLDDYLKKQERDGDPMLNYMRSKKKDKDRQEGRPEKPTYKGSFADNRFGIRPGYRWDGVDRSNGFEKKWFEMMSKKKAVAEEAYKYSVEDM